MRDALLIIHIIAAGAWIGASATVTFLNGRMRQAGHEAGAAFMEGYSKMGRMFFPAAGVVVLLSGILLVVDSSLYDFENAFVAIGIAVFIIGAFLGARVFEPIAAGIRSAHQARDEKALSAGYAKFRRMGALDLALLVFAVYAMVTKLGS